MYKMDGKAQRKRENADEASRAQGKEEECEVKQESEWIGEESVHGKRQTSTC